MLDEQQSGRSVELAQGESLVVRLKENPTTGYRWTVESADGLTLEGDGGGAAGAPGTAGLHEFRFRALQAGRHELRMKHWREWEGDKSAIGRFVVQVTVK
ncbi:MAG TPA: protease inhibitor I42 family protein [Paucimonas sp.]|nr:protease inhibitor I42 family protein [Paucimonas sp.]